MFSGPPGSVEENRLERAVESAVERRERILSIGGRWREAGGGVGRAVGHLGRAVREWRRLQGVGREELEER